MATDLVVVSTTDIFAINGTQSPQDTLFIASPIIQTPNIV